MAEFCYRCVNKMHGTHYSKTEFVLTDYLHLCEGCANYRRVVIYMRGPLGLFFARLIYKIKGFYITRRRKKIRRKILKQNYQLKPPEDGRY